MSPAGTQTDYGLGIGYDRTNKAVYITGYTTGYLKIGNFYIEQSGHAQVYVVRSVGGHSEPGRPKPP